MIRNVKYIFFSWEQLKKRCQRDIFAVIRFFRMAKSAFMK